MRTLIVFIFLAVGCQAQLVFPGNVVVKNTQGVPTPPDPGENDTAYIYMIEGQSNGAGRNAVTGGLGNYTTTYSYLTGDMIRSDDTAFTRGFLPNPGTMDILEAGHNSADGLDDNRAGIQPYLADKLLVHKEQNVYFIQGTQGGQNIIQWTQSVRDLHKWNDSTIANVKAQFIAAGKIPVFKAWIWIQGEANGGSDTTSYKGQLDVLLDLARDWTETPDLPFILVQMIDCQTGVTQLSNLQTAQANWVAATPGAHLMDKDGDPNSCQDTLHFAFDKMISLSERIFQLIKDW